MTSMLEKAARANSDELDKIGIRLRGPIHVAVVRAVLGAIREPDVAMSRAVGIGEGMGIHHVMGDPLTAWRRIIDTILNGGEKDMIDPAKVEEAVREYHRRLPKTSLACSPQIVRECNVIVAAAEAWLATLPAEPAVWAIVSFDGEPNIASGRRLLTANHAQAKLKELRAGFPLKVFALVNLSP